jgi:hypothetical protein
MISMTSTSTVSQGQCISSAGKPLRVSVGNNVATYYEVDETSFFESVTGEYIQS